MHATKPLKVQKREAVKKSQAKALRRAGTIPAVIYHRSKEAEPVAVDAAEFALLVKGVQPGRLCTTRFLLKTEGAKDRQAILKDIQYNPVTYEVIHLDFEELVDGVPVNVKVPVEYVGLLHCPGIKLGGFLRQVKRSVRVNCLPKDIPSHFPLDITEMQMYHSKRVKDLGLSNALKPLAKPNDVVVVIAKR